MSAYIGSLTLVYPLQVINKGEPYIQGYDVRTRSGDLVMVRPPTQNQTYRMIKARFEWEPRTSVDTLRSYWRSGASYNADLEGTGETILVKFAAKDGVDERTVKHQAWGDTVVHSKLQDEEGDSYATDLYTGELNLIRIG